MKNVFIVQKKLSGLFGQPTIHHVFVKKVRTHGHAMEQTWKSVTNWDTLARRI